MKKYKYQRDKSLECPCGSGIKWRHCCKESVNINFIENPRISIYKRNIAFYSIVMEILGLKNFKTDKNFARLWENLKENFCEDHVVLIYTAYKDIWKDFDCDDLVEMIPKSENKLRTVFTGYTKYRPDDIQKEILRLSLYTDEIILFSPFQPVWFMRPDYSPIENPTQWLSDTFKNIYYLFYLIPYIHSGVVVLVPKITDLDFKFQNKFIDLATQRHKEFEKNGLNEDGDDLLKYQKEHNFEEAIFSMPESYLKEKVKELNPEFSDTRAKGVVQYMKEINASKPYLLKREMDLEKESGQIECHHCGGNLETAMFMAQISNSYLSTNYKQRWTEMQLIVDQSINNWSVLSNAMQDLEFDFLNNVDPDFALEIRENERIKMMRNFLRKLSKNVEEGASSSEQVMELKEEMLSAYNEASSEWQAIKLKMSGISLSGGFAGTLPAILSGTLNPLIPIGGFAVAGIGALINEKFQRHNFRKNVPMSIFIDVEEK